MIKPIEYLVRSQVFKIAQTANYKAVFCLITSDSIALYIIIIRRFAALRQDAIGRFL